MNLKSSHDLIVNREVELKAIKDATKKGIKVRRKIEESYSDFVAQWTGTHSTNSTTSFLNKHVR